MKKLIIGKEKSNVRVSFVHKVTGSICFLFTTLLFASCGNSGDPEPNPEVKTPLEQLEGMCKDAKVERAGLESYGGKILISFAAADSATNEPLFYITQIYSNTFARKEIYCKLSNLKVQEDKGIITAKFVEMKPIKLYTARENKYMVEDMPLGTGGILINGEADYTWTYNTADHSFSIKAIVGSQKYTLWTGTWDPTAKPYTGLAMHYYTDGWRQEFDELTGKSTAVSRPEQIDVLDFE